MQPFSMWKTRILSIILVNVWPLVSLAQNSPNSQTVTVPLSEPGKKGQLIVDVHDGAILVNGHDGKDVIVEVVRAEEEDEGLSVRQGLRKISAKGFGVTVEERSNKVRVHTDDHQRRVDFVIKVPRAFNLKLRTHNNGEVSVENVSGEMDIASHNGGISLIGVGGSAWIETHNGGIRAEFNQVTADAPMFFKTYNGDVNLSMPSSYKAVANFLPGRGEVYSDFEVKLRKSEPAVADRDAGSGTYKVVLKDELVGEINGGGAALSMETYNGNLYVKKSK